MKKEPLISVIVPIYKVEEYLDECLQSIVHQTYTHLEIILVDDGSPDRCGSICDAYARTDRRIQVVHQSNQGLSCARNTGLHIATGSFISFIDSDDYLHPRFYECLLAAFDEQPNVGITACQIYKIEEGNLLPYNKKWNIHHPIRYSYTSFCEDAILGKNTSVTVWNKLYRAELVKNLYFREGRIVEDMLYMHDLSTVVKKHQADLRCIPEHLYYYRIRQGSISQSEHPLIFETLHAYEDIIRESQNNHPAFAKKMQQQYQLRILFFIGEMEQNKRWKEKYASTFHLLAKDIVMMNILQFDIPYRTKVALLIIRLCPKLYPFLRRIKRMLATL